MRVSRRFSLVATAACLLVAAETAPTMAQYQGPGGHYRSEASFVRDVNGTPCGMNCTQAAQKRWSRYYSQRAYKTYSAK